MNAVIKTQFCNEIEQIYHHINNYLDHWDYSHTTLINNKFFLLNLPFCVFKSIEQVKDLFSKNRIWSNSHVGEFFTESFSNSFLFIGNIRRSVSTINGRVMWTMNRLGSPAQFGFLHWILCYDRSVKCLQNFKIKFCLSFVSEIGC